MNLNRLYSIFGSDRLGRKDVQAYGQSTDQTVRNSVEQKSASSSFESDAIEGWEDLSFDTSIMGNLDKKFGPQPTIGWYKIVGGAAAVVGVSALVYLAFFNNQQSDPVQGGNSPSKVLTTLLEDQEITLEESDLVIPEPIERMKAIPISKQVQPKEIIKELEERIIFQEEHPNASMETIAPIVLIPENASPEVIRDHKFAKEVYLYSMKLVDYTKYRSKPAIKTRQMTLTGTPANMENENSEELDPVWKDVDIPYMEYVKKTMRTFERSRYKKALTRLETILSTYPSDVNGNFYAGICLYNLGEYNQAIDHFDKCLSGRFSNFDEEAIWMKAESYSRSGNKSKATSLYRQILDGKGYYSKQAKERLK